jgi:hypothetical protein
MRPEPKIPDFTNGCISVRITDVEAVAKKFEHEDVKNLLLLGVRGGNGRKRGFWWIRLGI